jgi:hypothetical protein
LSGKAVCEKPEVLPAKTLPSIVMLLPLVTPRAVSLAK